jgi:hypothetical protein
VQVLAAATPRKCELAHNHPSLFERTGPERVIHNAQRQIDHWPNENAADRACLDNCDAGSAYSANSRKGEEGATTSAETNKDR